MNNINEKLKQFIAGNFNGKNLKMSPDMKRDFNTLEQYLPQMFPEDIDFDVVLDLMEVLDKKDTKQQNPGFLPFHTRDNKWLADYAYATVKFNEPNTDLKFSNVKKYVAHSNDFDSFRRHYEENLTREQIKFMHDDYFSAGSRGYYGHLAKEKSNFDRNFRNEVVKSMTNIGVDEHSVEIALEKNANLWRNSAMMWTFRNRFYPLNAEIHDEKLWRYNMHNVRKHRKAWLRMREFMYYREHKAILDELGLVTKIMKMSEKEYTDLNNELMEYYKRHYSTEIDTSENFQDYRPTIDPVGQLKGRYNDL